MRKLFFLFPEMSMQQGGHSAQMAFLKMSQQFTSATAVTYDEPATGCLYLNMVLTSAKKSPQDYIFIVHWGPHVGKLLKRLKGFAVVYIAHSTGWGFKLPRNVPILAVSRHTQAYWAKQAPRNAIYYLPNVLDNQFYNNEDTPRTIDVLVMKRKTSRYVLKQLLPLLQSRCNVRLIDHWVDDIAVEMRNSKVFLYDSSEYWKKQGVSEGFGLPPLEAIACGCQVFSSLNDALSDYLEPGVNCHQLGIHSVEFDKQRIMNTIKQWDEMVRLDNTVTSWRDDNVSDKLNDILINLNCFFDLVQKQKALEKID